MGSSALERTIVLVFIIILAYTLKRRGFFKQDDYNVVAKICMNITLPAAVITGFGSYEQDSSLFLMILLGLICNVVIFAATWIFTSRTPRGERIYKLFALPGYQIGPVTLPLIGNILGAHGILITCMFDSGNAMLVCGGSYAIVSSSPSLSGGGRPTLKELLKRIFSTVPFVVYITCMIWVSVGLRMPGWLLALAAPAGAANSFMAMFMIGLMIEPKLDRSQLSATAKTLAVRYAIAIVLSLLFYFCTPFPLITRQALALIAFSPSSALAPIFTDKCGGDTALASFSGTVSIIISLFAMTVCMILLGL